MAAATLSNAIVKAIVQGECGDPFGVLGPHVIRRGRRPAVAIRAFLPGAVQVTVVPTEVGALPQPMERLHAAGLFEAVFADRREPFGYQLEVRDRDGMRLPLRGRLPVSLCAERFRPPPLGRGDRLPGLREAGGASRDGGRRDRGAVRGLGAERAAGQRGGRLERLGRPGARDAPPSRQRTLGDLHPGVGKRGAVQVRDPVEDQRAPRPQVGPGRLRLRGARSPHGLDGRRSRLCVGRCGVDGRAARRGTLWRLPSPSTRSIPAPGCGCRKRATAT